MRLAVKVFFLIITAVLLCGFGYKEYREHNYDTIYVHDVLRQGETIECVAEHYYNHRKEPRSYAEFRHDVMERNKIYFMNGNSPKAGAIICIEVRVMK